jgi:2-succinyl-6-hydroxy-2,4-cyclohexadiene-1-carboxylate synthase
MRPLWERLDELTMPVEILVGKRDVKFHAPGRRMAELLPRATFTLVPCGHVLALESPAAVAVAISGAPA